MIAANDKTNETQDITNTNRVYAPRVYAACLAAYNNGKLHGVWIDCDEDADDIRKAIEAMLKASPEPDAEEWAFHDHENWEGLDPSEGQDIDTLAQWAALLSEHGEAFGVYAANIGSDYATSEQFEDSYMGEIESEEKFAEDEYFELNGENALTDAGLDYSCIDWQYMARLSFQHGNHWSGKGSSGALYAFPNI